MWLTCLSVTLQGSSVVVYRDADIRRYQIFTYAEWPGGLYGSPSMAGTRPGGEGFQQLCDTVMCRGPSTLLCRRDLHKQDLYY